MLVEPGNQFSLTRAALSTCAARKNQILISSSFDSDSTVPDQAFAPILFQPWMASAPDSVRPLSLPFTPEIIEA